MIPFPDGRFLGSLLFRKLTKHKSVTTSVFQGALRALVKLIQLFESLNGRNKAKRLEELIVSVRMEQLSGGYMEVV